MHPKSALFLVVLLGLFLVLAACTGTPNFSPLATQAPVATTQSLSGTPATTDLVPQPTDVIGTSRTLNLNIEKDYLGKVIITFQGGNGNGHVTSFDVTVNRADGLVSTGKLGINIGDVLTLEGTKDTDRVIVVANMDDGKSYRIIDMMSRFRTLG